MNLRKRTLADWMELLGSHGVKGMVISEPPIISLALGKEGLPRLRRQKKPVLIKKQILQVSLCRESFLLGSLTLELILEQVGDKLQCGIKPIGGKQLELFHSEEEAIQRFFGEYNQFFKQGHQELKAA